MGSTPTPGTKMNTERHTESAHHIYGVRDRVVQVPGCVPGDVGSIPTARPESFTEPHCIFAVGQQFDCASVAQVVERKIEDLRVGGSTPSRGTKHKV